jgi:hypothetical protein
MGGIWPSRAQGACGRDCAGPAVAQGGRRRGRARGDTVFAGPTRLREREGGTAPTVDGRGEPAVHGGEPGRRWARRRFAAGDPVLGQRVGPLA